MVKLPQSSPVFTHPIHDDTNQLQHKQLVTSIGYYISNRHHIHYHTLQKCENTKILFTFCGASCV